VIAVPLLCASYGQPLVVVYMDPFTATLTKSRSKY